MKSNSLFFGLFVVVIFFIVFPLLFFNANSILDLPKFYSQLSLVFGGFLFLLGTAIFIYCSSIFIMIGKGTPVPIEPPKEFVTKGLYKYVRNPIYHCYFLIFFSYFLIFGRLLLLVYAFISIIAIHLYVVFHEEPLLKKRFGKKYDEYLEQVPRWIPKIGLW
ncbi:MAG: isoprenylcysteine carboxylmethyltransferase family protein [archaeon]